MPNPYEIQGNLPWQGGGGGLMLAAAGTDPVARQIGQSYNDAYQGALGFNQANYANILAGYQQTGRGLAEQQAGVAAGYGRLQGDVLGSLQGAEAGRRQDIASAFAQQRGGMAQDLINRGLGNTTVRSALERGLNFDQQRAYTDLAGQMAQLRAGYQSQLGLAGLGYQGQAALAQNQQANRQLDWMNTVEAGYPDAGAYAGLLGQRGAALQSEANRTQAASQFQQMMDAARQNRELAREQFGQMYGAGPRPQATPAASAPAATGGSAPAPRRGSRPVNQPLPPQAPAPYAPPRPPGGIGAPMPALRGGPAALPMAPVRGPAALPPRGLPQPASYFPRQLNVQGGQQQGPAETPSPGPLTLARPEGPWSGALGRVGARRQQIFNAGNPPNDDEMMALMAYEQMLDQQNRAAAPARQLAGAAATNLARLNAAYGAWDAGGVMPWDSAMMQEAAFQYGNWPPPA